MKIRNPVVHDASNLHDLESNRAGGIEHLAAGH